MSTTTNVKITISTRTDIKLQTSAKQLRAVTICSALKFDYGFDKSTINLIGDVYCPNTESSGKLCPHRRLFNLSAEATINVRYARLCTRCAKFLLKIKQLFCCLAEGFTFLKRVPSQLKLLLEISIVLASIASKKRNANLLNVIWKLQDPFTVVQSSFYVTRAREDDKNGQKRLTVKPVTEGHVLLFFNFLAKVAFNYGVAFYFSTISFRYF